MKVRYAVIALHPIPPGVCNDGVYFTKEQLQRHGETLSCKPLVLNHNGLPHKEFKNNPFAKDLPYPDNRTLDFKYDSTQDALVGEIELSDTATDVYIRMGLVKHLSVEHYPYTDGSIRFARLSLLTHDLEPRDSNTRIIRESRQVML